MFFPSFRRQPRRRRRSTQQIEQLEPRELLAAVTQLTRGEVTKLLDRASMATSTDDAIIAVVDRGGHILGVRVEQDVLTAIGNLVSANGTVDPGVEQDRLVYAIDGAVAKARTAAFFANGTLDSRIVPDEADPTGTVTPTVGPLTSRTIRNISQSTITQREVQSNPSTTDPLLRGPGFVAPIGVGQHFPPGIPNTPQVDLFAIEHTNRDSIVHPGLDSIKGTADDIALQQRFNIDPAFVPAGKTIDAPESYGFTSGLAPNAQARGIATLPGGLPLYRIFDQNPASATFQQLIGLDVVGGIGVFFPGTTDPDGAGPGQIGDATFEQNYPNAQTELERTNAPKVLEAEYAALFAIGGGMFGGLNLAQDRFVGGDFPIPFGRIDLVGITLQIIGPTVGVSGVRTIEAIGNTIPQGDVKLATAVNSTATTLTVNNGALLPADDGNPATVDFTVLIENEVLAVRDVVGNTLTVTRAQGGSVAAAHAAGKAVIAGTVQLAVALNNTATTLTVTDGTVLPADDGNAATVDFFVRIENEILAVRDVTGNTVLVDRAQKGSVANAHAKGKELVAGSGANQALKVTSSVAVALTPGATTLQLPDVSVFPPVLAVPFSIRIDNEEILVTSIVSATNTLAITRAQNGTVAAAHAIGATIRTVTNLTTVNGRVIGEGFLVTPHDSTLLTTATSSVSVALGIGSLTLTVPDASVFPAVDGNAASIDFFIRIENEVIAVTNKSGNTLTILRAQRGTVAASHAIGTTIFTTELTGAQVRQIIEQGIVVAADTETRLDLDNNGQPDLASDGRRVRAAIRLKVNIANMTDLTAFRGNDQRQLNRLGTNPGASAIMVLAVADADGNVLGLYRMHDSTIFSIDVAVAKARNTVYYAGPTLQAIDRVDDDRNGVPDANVPLGTAFTNRTFRFLAEPRFPQGVDGSQPGAFSILNETVMVGGVRTPVTQTQFLSSRQPQIAVRAADNNPSLGPVAASAFQTVLGFDAFNPGRNFRDPNNIANQNGIVFFPGSTPVYAGSVLNGGFGISGDGVDQDDVVTFYGAQGFLPPAANVIADEVKVRNTRLPYQKFNRNPFG